MIKGCFCGFVLVFLAGKVLHWFLFCCSFMSSLRAGLGNIDPLALCHIDLCRKISCLNKTRQGILGMQPCTFECLHFPSFIGESEFKIELHNQLFFTIDSRFQSNKLEWTPQPFSKQCDSKHFCKTYNR